MNQNHRQVGLHDAGTGEVVEGIVIAVPPRRRNGFVEGWAAVALEPAKMIAMHKRELGEDGLALAFLMVGSLDFENFILLKQSEIAKQLGMQRPNVSRAMKRLIDINMIIPGPKVGRRQTYRLNPHFGWRGSAKNHHEALKATAGPTVLLNRMKAANISGVIGGQTLPVPDELSQDAKDQLALPLSED